MIIWNLNQQLTLEKLSAAEKLWNEKGPKSYKMVYTKDVQGEKPTTIAVTVRDEKVTDVMMDGAPLQQDPDRKDDLRIYYSMNAQFLYIRRFLELDGKSGAQPVYCVAQFDPHTGALGHYVRTEQQTKQRVELIFKPLEPLKN